MVLLSEANYEIGHYGRFLAGTADTSYLPVGNFFSDFGFGD